MVLAVRTASRIIQSETFFKFQKDENKVERILCADSLLHFGAGLWNFLQSLYFFSDHAVKEAQVDPKDAEIFESSKAVYLVPDGKHPKSVTMTNGVTGKTVRVFPGSFVDVDESVFKPNTAFEVVSGLSGLTILVLIITVFYKFIRFVWRVNKGEVFDHKSVRLLRQCGWLLLASYLLFIAVSTWDAFLIADQFRPVGYRITTQSLVNMIDLASCFFILAMAEVLSIGIELREDQKLTI